jgi:hypothetical protein
VAQSNAAFRHVPLPHIVLLEQHREAHCGLLASFEFHRRRPVVSQNVLLVSVRHLWTECLSELELRPLDSW